MQFLQAVNLLLLLLSFTNGMTAVTTAGMAAVLQIELQTTQAGYVQLAVHMSYFRLLRPSLHSLTCCTCCVVHERNRRSDCWFPLSCTTTTATGRKRTNSVKWNCLPRPKVFRPRKQPLTSALAKCSSEPNNAAWLLLVLSVSSLRRFAFTEPALLT